MYLDYDEGEGGNTHPALLFDTFEIIYNNMFER